MPEAPEVDTDRLQEHIKDEVEQDRHGGGLLKQIALSTALLAACAAVASLWAGATVNEALVLKTEATRDQAEASNQWAYYQAKGIKATVHEASRSAWLALGKQPPPIFEAEQRRYAAEQAEIKQAAEEKERHRDQKSHEADHLLHRHHSFANAVALMQVAIALGAVAALTRTRRIWLLSMVVGVAGVALFVFALLH